MNKPEKLILDCSKWRCGGDGVNKLGNGFTNLLNKEGFSCCIGQWSKQQGATDVELKNQIYPSGLSFKIPLFTEKKSGFNSSLANDCMIINDDTATTPNMKISQLRDRLKQEGIKLKVINKP